MNKKTVLSFLIILAAGFTRLFAAYNSLGIPDSAEIRKTLIEQWFEAPLLTVRTNNAFETRNQIGEEFQVRLEEDDRYFYIFVAPHSILTVNVFTSKKTYTEQQDYYPGDVAGSFVLIRDKKTGEPLCARYYFLKDSGVYVQFTPYGKAALSDLVIFGNYAARGVATGLPFEYFYSASIEDVMSVTKNKLPWSYVLTSKNEYHAVRQMITLIDEALPSILYCPDAMYDEDDKLIHVRDGSPFLYEQLPQTAVNKSIFLSSAGFLKWICDGLVEPIAGKRDRKRRECAGSGFERSVLKVDLAGERLKFEDIAGERNRLSLRRFQRRLKFRRKCRDGLDPDRDAGLSLLHFVDEKRGFHALAGAEREVHAERQCHLELAGPAHAAAFHGVERGAFLRSGERLGEERGADGFDRQSGIRGFRCRRLLNRRLSGGNLFFRGEQYRLFRGIPYAAVFCDIDRFGAFRLRGDPDDGGPACGGIVRLLHLDL